MSHITEPSPPREGTKLALLLRALSGKGAPLSKLSTSLSWQPHTVRAAITRLRQRGYTIECAPSAANKPSIYRVSAAHDA